MQIIVTLTLQNSANISYLCGQKPKQSMKIINFDEENSVMHLYMAELRDKNHQRNRLLFRNNIKRVGELMAYEISKTLDYKLKSVTTPLGICDIQVPKDEIVVGTVLRAVLLTLFCGCLSISLVTSNFLTTFPCT